MAPQRTTGKVQKRTSHRGGPKQARRGSVESESSDGTLRASNIEPGHEASRKMLKRFAAKVGKVVTLEQVAAASQWMTSMQCTENDLQKFATFNSHAEKIGLQKVWPEIIMYRSIGQISTYFLDGQRLRNGGQSDINALDELEISVVGWVRLASEGRLSRLEESAEIEDGEGQYSTQAERFKTFLTEFKHRGNFTVWNYDQMKMLRYMIYKVVHEPVGLEHTPRQSTDPPRRFARITDEESSPEAPGSYEEESTHGDEHSPGVLARRILALETGLKGKRKDLREARAAAQNAQNILSDFDERVLLEVKDILEHRRAAGQEWTIAAAEVQARRFDDLGRQVSQELRKKLVEPLSGEQEIEDAIRIAEAKIARLKEAINATSS